MPKPKKPAQQACKLEREITITVKLEYLLYLPKGYAKGPNAAKKKWPLMLFLHGSGERGSNLEMVKVHGIPKLIEAGQEFPFIVVSPQCPAGYGWTKAPLGPLLDDLEQHLQIDTTRVYLTGLSMGGAATWGLANDFPNRFAALAPICGGGDEIWMGKITHLPIWAFHGAKDELVPLEETTKLVNELKRLGSKKVKLTVYKNAGHDSWTRAYANPKLYEWMLAHTQTPNPTT
jgi:predicted peptidase